MEPWELVAREAIRDTLAAYSWGGDALRLDDVAGAFCEDGQLEVRGRPPIVGRAAIVEFLGGVGAGEGAVRRPTLVRHLVTNTRFVEVTPEAARVESYFSVLTDIGLDHHGRYRDVHVPVGDRWLLRHRFVSTDWRAPDSLLAAPDAVP